MPRRTELTPDSLASYFGARLQRAREGAGLSLLELGKILGYSDQWIYKMEHALKTIKEEFADDVATHFKDPEFIELWKAMEREGRQDLLPRGFPEYIALEARATMIRKFAQLLPGLFQTEAYARAVMTAGRTVAKINDIVAARMERQEILTRDEPPEIRLVIDEAALRRPIGGPEVMRDQLKFLREIAEQPKVWLHVLPFESITYAAFDGPFSVLTLPDGSEVGYCEGPEIAQVIDDPELTVLYGKRFELIMGEALPRSATLGMIQRYQEDYAK